MTNDVMQTVSEYAHEFHARAISEISSNQWSKSDARCEQLYNQIRSQIVDINVLNGCQLFLYTCPYINRKVIIKANSPNDAHKVLEDYLNTHPLLPRVEYWTLNKILGKVDDNIFSLS